MLKNLEIKYSVPDAARFVEVCMRATEYLGRTTVLRQEDVYYSCNSGTRLKLRIEQVGTASAATGDANATLIPYARSDSSTVRHSDYALFRLVGKTQAADIAATRALLDSVLTEQVCVKKERRYWLWRGVRVHLDSVQTLGNFVEFEALLDTMAEAQARELVDTLYKRLQLDAAGAEPQALGYRELLLAHMPALSKSGVAQ